MSVVSYQVEVDELLTGDVIAHLDAQLISARRLLAVVLQQGAAIRDRDVHRVVGSTGLVQAELQQRALIEFERTRLLQRAGLRLGVTAGLVSLTLLEQLMPADAVDTARARSAELRGLLEEIQREHYCNRALMNQELAFLDHLLRLTDGDRQLGYDAGGDRSTLSSTRLTSYRVLDFEV